MMNSKLSGDNVNFASVTRELLDLIMKLPGRERAALTNQLNPAANVVYDGRNTSAITTGLIDAIMKTTMDRRCEILGDLKALNGSSKRKYSRIEYFAAIQYLIQERAYSGYIRNISISGLFIETSSGAHPGLFPGEPIIMNFDHPHSKQHLKIGGQVARITKTGLGIRFYETLEI